MNYAAGSSAGQDAITLTVTYQASPNASGSATASVTIQAPPPPPPTIVVTPDNSPLTVGLGSPKLDFSVENRSNDPVDISLSANCGAFACSILVNGQLAPGSVQLAGVSTLPVQIQINVTAAQQGMLNVPIVLSATETTRTAPAPMSDRTS